MKKTLAQVTGLIEEKSALVIAKHAEAKSIEDDPEQVEAFNKLVGEMGTLNDELDALDEESKTAVDVEGIAAKAAERHKSAIAVVSRPTAHIAHPSVKSAVVPATAVRARVTAFKGSEEEKSAKAYGMGMWFLASQFNSKGALDYCSKNGIAIERETKAGAEGVNSLGGALVPVQYGNDLIDLRESYGVFEPNAKTEAMTSDTKIVPRRDGGLTAYFVSENGVITDSDKGWGNVQLTAHKIAVLSRYSSEYNEDAMIQVGNDLAEEIAYAFSQKIDACGFLGDGTSAYGGMVGLATKLRAVDATIANIKGLVVASGNAYGEILLSDFNKVKSILPEYARRGRVKWYMSRAFYSSVAEKLMLASGGVTAAELAAGMEQPRFMGYDVEITQTMPQVEGNSQICAYLGDLGLSSIFGDRRQTAIATSTDRYFDQDQWAIRGTMRFDINNHSVGDTTNAGPVVGLITAAS